MRSNIFLRLVGLVLTLVLAACAAPGSQPGAMAVRQGVIEQITATPAQQVIVRTGSGVLVSVTQPVSPGLRVGQRVYIEGSGEGARVLPQ